ncbi:membrane protein insertion efficiency factor YidD [Candidatus Uhrbacteria bacterium]|nr:membrane protein insertion efficiency factor YidD [Candidatus Uhrbacteria bacterium]
MIKRLVIFCIRLYQLVWSPDHSWRRVYFPFGYCKFHPSCSQYLIASLERQGLFKGLAGGLGRLWRCRPGVSGGFDPVR